MKTCPHCNASCEDADIVCSNCGYLFNAENIPYPTDGEADKQPSQQTQQSQQSYQPPVNYPQPGPEGFQSVPVPKKTNGLATAGMILGILGVVLGCCGVGLIFGIVGAILSVMALNKIGKTGEGGKGMAIAGIICSAVGILLGGYMVISFIVAGQNPAFWDAMNKAIENAKQAQSTSSQLQ